MSFLDSRLSKICFIVVCIVFCFDPYPVAAKIGVTPFAINLLGFTLSLTDFFGLLCLPFVIFAALYSACPFLPGIKRDFNPQLFLLLVFSIICSFITSSRFDGSGFSNFTPLARNTIVSFIYLLLSFSLSESFVVHKFTSYFSFFSRIWLFLALLIPIFFGVDQLPTLDSLAFDSSLSVSYVFSYFAFPAVFVLPVSLYFFFRSKILLGRLLAAFQVFCVCLLPFYYPLNKNIFLIFLTSMSASIYFIFLHPLSFSRTFSVFRSLRFSRRSLLYFIFTAICLVLSVYYLFFLNQDSLFARLLKVSQDEFDISSLSILGSRSLLGGRIELWGSYLAGIFNHPLEFLLFSLRFGHYPPTLMGTTIVYYPAHNLFIEILYNLGFLFFLPFVFFVTKLIRSLVSLLHLRSYPFSSSAKSSFVNNYSLGLLVLSLSWVVTLMFGNFFIASPVLLFFFSTFYRYSVLTSTHVEF